MSQKQKRVQLLLFLLFSFQVFSLQAQEKWQAQWITDPFAQNESNSWYCLLKEFSLKDIPLLAKAKIAVDTKYWLWINGEMVVFEGGLKRGPNPEDTYYDEIDIAKYLKKGQNSIAALAWYFGKDGFSHVSSGKFGFLFECLSSDFKLVSDGTWKVLQHPAYETCHFPKPNFRLSESSIRFDARNDLDKWYSLNFNAGSWRDAQVLGSPPSAPWNQLVKRPIPQWKDFGLTAYDNKLNFPIYCNSDTLICCALPANLQVTPYLKIEADEGAVINIKTDNLFGGGEPNMYAEYVTKNGQQEYESYGWINGDTIFYTIPKGVKVLDLKYRQTGFDTEFSGSFSSSDDFLNTIWQKSRRTLYVTMRDNYMDCPDRERAQWWGDAVNEGGEAFYALCPKSHSLLKKGMYELIGWQREDSTIFSPIPAVNWDKELPTQMLTSIGYYGFWNYYMHTGDKQTIADLYDGVRKYLKIWKFDSNDILIFRSGGWTWGDWGQEKDLLLIYNTTYFMALKGAALMAELLAKNEDADEYRLILAKLKTAFNQQFWTGKAYRDPNYKGQTDDRSQALAVVSGLADADKYPAIFEVLKKEEHASPYMEKYVLEALFQMGYEKYAIERMKKRFGKMVNNTEYTTMFEGWGIGSDGFGGGTTNHAWSGGALTILSQYLCGIAPVEPGCAVFQVLPQPASIETAKAEVLSVKGLIQSKFTNLENEFDLSVVVPKESQCVIGIPNKSWTTIELNGNKIWCDGKNSSVQSDVKYKGQNADFILFEAKHGKWEFTATF